MKAILKRALFAAAPEWSTAFFSERARAHSQRVIEGWGCGRINRSLFDRFGNCVLGGPFAGLALSPSTLAEQIGPCLLGVYESELHPAWEVVFEGRYTQVVDIGAKVGYYTVGLARRLTQSRVVAFDTDRWARRVIGEMVALNDVSNVEIHGYCSPSWFADHLEEGAFVVSDCEGFEGDLFCSGPIPNLATATLIIETHDVLAPRVTSRLRERLYATHHLVEIPSGSPPPVSLDLSFLSEREQSLAKYSVRLEQVWLLALPKGGPNATLKEGLAAAGLGRPPQPATRIDREFSGVAD